MERHVRAFVCTCVCVFFCTCVCVCVCVRVRAQLSMRSTSEFVLTSVTVGGTFANHKCTSSSTYRAPYLCQSHQHMPKPLTYFLPVPTAYKKTQTHTHKSTHIDTHTHTHTSCCHVISSIAQKAHLAGSIEWMHPSLPSHVSLLHLLHLHSVGVYHFLLGAVWPHTCTTPTTHKSRV